MIRTLSILTLLLAGLALPLHSQAAGPPSGTGTYEDLVNISDEFLVWREGDHPSRRFIEEDPEGRVISAIPDNRPEATEARLEALNGLQRRMTGLNVAAWKRSEQVDWLALRSRLDQQEFLLRIARPWERDPGYYVDRMLWLTFADLPLSGDNLEGLVMELRSRKRSSLVSKTNSYGSEDMPLEGMTRSGWLSSWALSISTGSR